MALDDHNDKVKNLKQAWEEESKDPYVYKVEERVNKITAFLKTMARAAEYAK